MKLGISLPSFAQSCLVFLKEKNIKMCAWNIYGHITMDGAEFDDDYSCHIDWIKKVL